MNDVFNVKYFHLCTLRQLKCTLDSQPAHFIGKSVKGPCSGQVFQSPFSPMTLQDKLFDTFQSGGGEHAWKENRPSKEHVRTDLSDNIYQATMG